MAFPRALAVLAAVSLLVAACGHRDNRSGSSSTSSSASSSVQSPTAAPVPSACGNLGTLPARDKLAQLLMVGVRNADDARAVVTDHHVGGIMIDTDTDKSMLTSSALKDLENAPRPLPLAVSVDEEGGRVSRLKALIGSSPSPRELARTQTEDQVYNLALDRGRKMKDLGITVDLAPVVDVTDAPEDTVIGDRSFSDDPAKVTAYAGAYARGLRDAGLVPVLKHFPGHGRGSGDSHTGGVTTPPLSDLVAVDLVPYQALVTQAPVAVMLGHLQVQGLTGANPASLSPEAVQLLRTGTGYGGPSYDGPIITDDLSSMAAISDRFGVTDAVLLALKAGTDIALWVTTKEVPAVLDRLEQALSAGELDVAAVDASLGRVAKMKCGR